MELVSCWIEHPIRTLDQPFTYDANGFHVSEGTRILVSFGYQKVIGFVESIEHTDETLEQAEQRLGVKIKPVEQVLDTISLITPELHDMAMWMRDSTLSTAISCFQCMLPSKIKPLTGSGAGAVKEKWVRRSEEEVSLTPKQLEAYQYLAASEPMLYSELRKKYPSIARVLVEKKAVIVFEKERRAANSVHPVMKQSLHLTIEQENAMHEILSTDDDVYLIKGVTGSGKTEIYLQLAQIALDQGKQVLILVPEISLTPQMIERVSSRFGSELAIYHSALNPQEKYEQYQKVRCGRARVVVGTRSSVFLPFESLGLIVMDEEQDESYKQDSQPTYHCRDAAIYRGRYHHCKVILGSATPSLESNARAIKDVYHLITLKERVNKCLPEVTIIPLKNSIKNQESYILSDELKEKIQMRLDRKQQIILLLNRRGYTSILRCRSCQSVIRCPHCELAMSYHRKEKLLKCHTCGTMLQVPQICPACGQRAGYSTYGFGTERLEQEVQQTFPGARILRMDADTTIKKNSYEKILNAFGNGGADILLGTQMIAKGLDYPDVTLVGIINGDEGLARTDYRSCETTFDLLMQAAGRSGRSSTPGEVVFQVFDPNHYAVQCAARQDYDTFFRMEMKFRHAGQYPPYTYIISLTASGTNQQKVEQTALWLKQGLISTDFKTIGVLQLLKIRDHFRSRVILKGKDLDSMRSAVRHLFEQDGYDKAKNVKVDVNPISLD